MDDTNGFAYDRVDFVPVMKCSFCNNKLTSGKAFILRDIQTGKDRPCGPTCAVKMAGKRLSKLPDFTRAAFELLYEIEDEKPCEAKGLSTTARTTRKRKKHTKTPVGYAEAEYLRLRMEKLKDFPNIAFKGLQTRWDRFREGKETPNDIEFVQNLMAKAEREMPLLTRENLQACYAYSFWIRQFLTTNKGQKPEFVTSLLNDLQNKSYLTIGQINGLNRWFEKRKSFPKLDPNAFKEAIKRNAIVKHSRKE